MWINVNFILRLNILPCTNCGLIYLLNITLVEYLGAVYYNYNPYESYILTSFNGSPCLCWGRLNTHSILGIHKRNLEVAVSFIVQ